MRDTRGGIPHTIFIYFVKAAISTVILLMKARVDMPFVLSGKHDVSYSSPTMVVAYFVSMLLSGMSSGIGL